MPAPTFPVFGQLDDKVFADTRRRSRIGQALNRYPLIEKVMREIAGRCRSLYDNAQIVRENDRFLPLANVETKSSVGYENADDEVRAFLGYRHDVRTGRIERTESGELYRRQIETISKIIEADPSIRNVLNFGVCYAHVDAVLAKRFPTVHFWGIDRSPFTKALNEVEFGDIDNLHFVTGDAFDLIKTQPTDVLFHSRTAICLNKPMVQRLYEEARKAGIRYVVGFEQYGTSWETLEPYRFDLTDKPSVLYRHFMFIHNYPGLLAAAGYDVEQFEIFKTASGKADMRIIAMVGKLI